MKKESTIGGEENVLVTPSQPQSAIVPAYGDPPSGNGDLEQAAVVIIPAPLEYTTCYRTGTAHGPAAILHASTQMELYEEEQEWIPMDRGIATLPLLDYAGLEHTAALQRTQETVAAVLARGQFPFTLGGEHSLTPACVRAVQHVYADLGVISFDAHSDLRNEYEGSPHSHACALRRTLEIPGIQALEIGIRSSSREEVAFFRQQQLPLEIIWAHQVGSVDFDAALARLPAHVYVTVDLDCFDPGIMPAVGTPEPGGLDWGTFLRLFRRIVHVKTIVAGDVVELCPLPGYIASDFFAAKLIYKMLGSVLWKMT